MENNERDMIKVPVRLKNMIVRAMSTLRIAPSTMRQVRIQDKGFDLTVRRAEVRRYKEAYRNHELGGPWNEEVYVDGFAFRATIWCGAFVGYMQVSGEHVPNLDSVYDMRMRLSFR